MSDGDSAPRDHNGDARHARGAVAQPRTPPNGPLVSAGIDLIDLERFRLAVRRTEGKVLDRILAPEEHAEVSTLPKERQAYAAARVFGIKEGAIKALGGLPPGARFTDITMPSSWTTSPWPLRLHGPLASYAQDLGVDLYAGGADLPHHRDLALAWVLATVGGRSHE